MKAYPCLVALCFLFGLAAAEETLAHSMKKLASSHVTCWLMDEGDLQPVSMRVDYKYEKRFPLENRPQGAGGDFHWMPVPNETNVEHQCLVRRNGRDFIEYTYLGTGPVGRDAYLAVMVMREEKDGWLRPVFIAYPEEKRYACSVVSNVKWPLALVVEMDQSGSGAHAARLLFDISSSPRLAIKAYRHRMREADYPNERELLKALREMAREMARANGE